ncbi:N-acetylmuramoyl-L-alanine amidase [Pleurocapsales cyanobacterium LEGE 06147]|nr:N-acetylmuramoyl-L-alanine amidase [Pleurocapsales cyanobacterium LEGE 06147]
MKRFFGIAILAAILIVGGMMLVPVAAQTKQSLFLAYPPPEHQTTAETIFLIGTASPSGDVFINGKPIERSPAGHFAPSFPLQMGVNLFTIRHENEEIKVEVTKVSSEPEIPQEAAFAEDSLTPAVNVVRLPGESICFGAMAPPNAEVSVRLGGAAAPATQDRTISLLPQPESVQLPPNSAILTSHNQPTVVAARGRYQGCTTFSEAGNLGKPLFELRFDREIISQEGKGEIDILSPNQLEVIEVTADAGVARTGPSTDYSRLTPLPKGTIARVTGKEGEWLRLDYGAWIKEEETKPIASNIPPTSFIRSITSRPIKGATEIIFPLQIPVPVSVRQGDKFITLTLYNTTAQTDTIRLDDDPLIKRLDWQQVTPTRIDYTFYLKTEQQWGYDLRYEGTSLIFTLRHAPPIISQTKSLKGVKILLDPGHGGEELGAKGPTGYPEKDANLVMSQLLAQELKKLGATVDLTRDTDVDLSLEDRVKIIDDKKPDIALSIHYNALPDGGDAINTKGIGVFWYYPQGHEFAVFLHNYLVEKLDRPSYGVYWNNLALTRPHTAPSVLLELGFMINPWEFEWITNPQEQKQLARAIAEGIKEWFLTVR